MYIELILVRNGVAQKEEEANRDVVILGLILTNEKKIN